METESNQNSVRESAEEQFATHVAKFPDEPVQEQTGKLHTETEFATKLSLFRHVLGSISRSPGVSNSQAQYWADRIIADNLSSQTLQPRSSIRNRGWFKNNINSIAAALILVVMGSSYGIYHSFYTQPSSNSFSEVTTYITSKGEQSFITLPDGSTVLLNVDSKLEVAAGFDKDNRNIRLDGEALFSVVHQSSKAFTVNAGQTVSRVMGTIFTVRHYATDSVTTIAVKSGKVAVNDVVITPDQLLTVNRDDRSYIAFASEANFSFAKGALTLEDIPLAEAIGSLNRWYDAEIIVVDSEMAKQRLNGVFKSGSIPELVGLLEFMFNSRIEQNGKTITLYPR